MKATKKLREIQGTKLNIGFSYSLGDLPFKRGFFQSFEKASIPLDYLTFIKKVLKENVECPRVFLSNFMSLLLGIKKCKLLNRDYRNKDKTNRCLSFPVYENIREERKCFLESLNWRYYLFLIRSQKQAKEFDVTEESEFFHLMIHGFLHLLGLIMKSQQKEESWKAMRKIS